MGRITKITKGVSKGIRSKLIKGNEELITLLLIYALIILWTLNFNT